MPRFNPKREAHPLQTLLSDAILTQTDDVSIPNGKPILFRRCQIESFCPTRAGFNPKREAHPLQTGVSISCECRHRKVSIPNGKPILFRLGSCERAAMQTAQFQSQTGSPSSSDEAMTRTGIVEAEQFQSQT